MPFCDFDHATIGLTNLTNYSVQHFLYFLSHFEHYTQQNTCTFIIMNVYLYNYGNQKLKVFAVYRL